MEATVELGGRHTLVVSLTEHGSFHLLGFKGFTYATIFFFLGKNLCHSLCLKKFISLL